MEFEAEHRFEGSRQLVWDSLHDPAILSKALPGNASMEVTEDGTYVGELRAGVGPVTAARFDVKVTLAEEVPPEAFTMVVDGRGAAGFVEGPVRITLAEDGPSATVMAYAADLQIGGRIAGVGQRLLDTVGKGMARKSLEDVNKLLAEPREEVEEAAATGIPDGVAYVDPAADDEVTTSSLSNLEVAEVGPPSGLSRPVVVSIAAIIVIILLVILL